MSHKGTYLSAEVRARISQREKGKVVGLETRAKISLAGRGKQNSLGTRRSADSRARMSELKRGIPLSSEHRARIANGARLAHGNQTGSRRGGAGYPDDYFPARLLVFKRDDYRCQICRKHGVLNAHHLNYDKSDNHLNNLVTLCGTCHISHHGKRAWPVSLGRTACFAA